MAGLRPRRAAGRRHTTSAGAAVADVRPWPHDPTIAHLVVLDVASTPTVDQIVELTQQTFSDPAIRSIRTSALFPGPRDRFAEAGYTTCERLALLDRPVDRIEPIRRRPDRAGPDVKLSRLGQRRLAEAAAIDDAAFPEGWGNTADTLADIIGATPKQRSRMALDGSTPVGFSITGLAGTTGYLQRLAVHPDHHRRGIARLLVDDVLRWLQRRGASTVLVNTGVDNEPALELYRSLGFRDRRDELVVMEHTR